MKHIWLYLSRTDIETERRQCEDEGRDLSSVEEEFERVLGLDLEDLRNQPAAEALLDRTIELPVQSGYAFVEPSDLQSIRAERPVDRPALPALVLSDSELEDKVYGAWTGRCVGCLLGKPVEGWRRPRMWGYLKDLGAGRWPTTSAYDAATDEARAKFELIRNAMFADRVSAMPEDDDTNYTTTGLAIMKQSGAIYTWGRAEFWLERYSHPASVHR